MNHEKQSYWNAEQKIIEWITHLVRSDEKVLGRTLIKGLRFVWRHRPFPIESISKEAAAYPTGPFTVKYRPHMGDLLLWVPLKIDSFIIDDLTGGYGYSHVTVDTGEVDLPTGKPVMVEVTIGQAVERKFQDEYARRAYARIPLAKTGVDGEAFVACVKSRLGESYDTFEALSLGEIDDPVKQMCSGLAADCLPEPVRREIAKALRFGLLRRSSVSVYSTTGALKTKAFISPNGFAQYYGVPKGQKLHGTDIRVEPRPLEISVKSVMRKHGWKAGLILAAAGALIAGILLFFLKSNRS